ncbi:MAG: glycine/betaine ABC transporter [Acidiferrobacter sp.]|nr:glycine/betaine ABC transporter [Acidiferrobacter sp.]
MIIEGENQPRSEPEIIDGLEEFLLADQVRTFSLLVMMALYSGSVRTRRDTGVDWKASLKHVKTYSFAGMTALGFMLIDNMMLWEATMESLALIFGAAAVSLIIGIPIGILMAYSRWADVLIKPLLDLMQTMPAFVYLIPAIVLFSTGVVSAMLATVIFAAPPLIRLTAHGIRGVDIELVEAGKAFGAGPITRLIKIELPMARPTIFVGINQMIMLSLSMIVIAALIGAEGLGNEIMRAINRINPGAGFEAGLAIVILAIYLDRFVGAFGAETN